MEELYTSRTRGGSGHPVTWSIPPLPQRATPYLWEDLSSLLSRVARKMGYPDLRWILRPQESPYGINASDLPLLTEQRDFLLLQQLLLLNEATLSSLTAHIFAHVLDYFAKPENNSTSRLRPQYFASYFLEYPRTRICPQCLAESPTYDRIFWRMRHIFFCPFHRTRLRDFCPRCSRTISALRLEPFRCPSCQQGDYREPVEAPIAQNHLLYVGTVLFLHTLGITLPEDSIPWQQVCPLFPRQASTTTISLLRHVTETFTESFTLEELLTLLVDLSALSPDDISIYPEIFTTSDTAAFFLFHAFLFQWPTQFSRLLDQLYALAAPPFLGQKRVAVVDRCQQLFEHGWLKSAFHSHLQSYRSDAEATRTAQACVKAILERIVLPAKAQTSQQTEYLFLEEQRPSSPLAQVVPFPWESLPSIIARTARQMDGIHPRQFLRPAMNLHHLSEQDLLALTRDEDYTILEYALHIDAKELYDGTLHRFAGLFQRWDRFPVSSTFPSLELNTGLWLFPDIVHTKVCPQCLEEEGYDRLYWTVRGLAICPYHRIRLVEVCPVCQKKIPSLRPSVFQCPHCATGDYRRATSPLFPEDHLLTVTSCLFFQALGILLPSSWCLPAHLAPSPLLGISAMHYFRLLEQIAFEFFGELPQQTLLTVLRTIQSSGGDELLQPESGDPDPFLLAIVLFHVLFTCWPTHLLTGLDALCRNIRVPPYRRFVYGMEQCQKYFRRLFDEPGFSWLREAFEQHEQQFYRSTWYEKAEEKEWEGFQGWDPLYEP